MQYGAGLTTKSNALLRGGDGRMKKTINHYAKCQMMTWFLITGLE
jgi:hypothetical protein